MEQSHRGDDPVTTPQQDPGAGTPGPAVRAARTAPAPSADPTRPAPDGSVDGFCATLNAEANKVRQLLVSGSADDDVAAAVAACGDAEVLELFETASRAKRAWEQLSALTSGVIAARSQRAAGQQGLAQARGHRNAVSLVQHVSGVSRTEAFRQVRAGEALLEPHPPDPVATDAADPDTLTGAPVAPPVSPWHEPVRTALRHGTVSVAQHDAIRRGLGEPPTPTSPAGRTALGQNAEATAGAVEAWRIAAAELVTIAPDTTVEDLARQARAVRDLLDPVGAEHRFQHRYEQRSFTLRTDADGTTRGIFVFDDESAAWVRTIIDNALRPRRGGPRFMTDEERARAEALQQDPRTNPQLTHDLLIDVLHAGAIADAETVFGTRQAGIRLVQTVDREHWEAEHHTATALNSTAPPATSGLTTAAARSSTATPAASATPAAGSGATVAPVTRFEDGGDIVPDAVAARTRCNTGIIPVTADRAGNPLDAGREQRLYTSRQRIALAARDGGCRWPACDRPASYCEAHHIDEWAAHNGRTDIDRGILLCRFHHLQLHANHWRITRDGHGPFLLHRPTPAPHEQPPETRAEGTTPPRIGARGTALPTIGAQGTTPPTTRAKGRAPSATGQERTGPNSTSSTSSTSSTNSTGASPPAADDAPIEMRAPLPLTYTWRLTTPPPARFRPSTAA